MRINTNFSSGSLAGQYISEYGSEIEKSLARITSGMRITQPSEDAPTFFKSESLKSRAESTKSVSRDLSTHISRNQAAEGYLNEVKNMLEDMSKLALKASNEDNATVRTTYGKEYDEKVTALGKFLDSATYEDEVLLKGAYDSNSGGSAKKAKVSEDPSAASYSYDILDTRATQATGLNLGSASSATTDWADAGAGKSNANNYYKVLTEEDSGIKRVERNILRVGTHLSVLNGSKNALDVKAQNYSAASSALTSVNDVEESTRLSNMQIRRQVAASFLAQNNVQQSQVIGLMTKMS